jgi:homocysteine S-methyltransferase
MGSGKECEIALKTIKSFKLPVLVGVHIKKDGKLPSGENISEIVKKYKEENWLGIIAACVHPESYEIIIKELKNLDIPYGFKLNAFKNIPDDYGVRSPSMWGKGGNPTKILGSRTDINESKFYEFVKKFKDDGATILGGCCEIRPSHIKNIAKLK